MYSEFRNDRSWEFDCPPNAPTPFLTSASLNVLALLSPTQTDLSHRVGEVVTNNFQDGFASWLCLQRKIGSFPLVSSDLKFSEKMPDWPDLDHALSHVAIRFTPVIDSSPLNHGAGVRDLAAAQEKGSEASRLAGSWPDSSLSVECRRSMLMSPRSWGDFSQIALFIFV